MAKADAALGRAMQNSLKLYASGNRRFFDYLEDDVRVFVIEASQPILGRKKFQSYYGATFAKIKRKVAVLSSDVQQTGEQAILAQTLRITANGVNSIVRQTVVWKQDDGEWKMSHIHNALVGQPLVAGKPPRTAVAVRILNERIATASAAVGVAQ